MFNSGRCQRSIEQGVTAFGVIEQFIFELIVARWVVHDKEKEKTSKNFLLNTLFEMCSSAEHWYWTELVGHHTGAYDELLEGGDHLLQMGGECGVMNIELGFLIIVRITDSFA